MKNRAISEKFFNELKSGKYQNILQTVKQDDDLIMCLRGDYITIYYKSMRILEISENGEYDVDKNYGIIPPNDDTNWIEYFKNAKFALSSYNKTKQINKLEKEVQQAIVKENNTSSICNETDYFIIDIEYTQPEFDGRFDALAVYWPKNKRKNGHDLQLAFIEVKAGNNAIGGTSGIVKHYESVIEFLNNLTKNNEKEQFIQDIEKEELLLATQQGYSIRFDCGEIRATGRDTMGVKGLVLRDEDTVVSALLIKDKENSSILTITENGYGKRTRIDEYPLQSRYGKGVINLRCSAKTGAVVSVLSVTTGEELMAITSSGVVIRIAVEDIVLYGRATQGVIIMKVNGKDEKVVSITRVKSEDSENEEAQIVDENLLQNEESTSIGDINSEEDEIIEETVE